MSGDEHGDLNLDKALTRAELTCLISPRPEPGTRSLGEGSVHPDVYYQLFRCAGVGSGGCWRMRLHGNDGQTWGRAVWPRQSSQPVDGMYRYAPLPGTGRLRLRYRLREGRGAGAGLSQHPGKRHDHTGRYGDPAGWFAGLSGVSSNTVKKLERKLNKAASGPGVQAHQGPLILL